MRPKLVLFGDSITEESFGAGGWGAALAHEFSRTLDVVLRGYSGYNTRWARMALDRVVDGLEVPQPPVAVTIFFGANDACLPDRSGGFQHVPLEEYKENLRAICAALKERWSDTVLILITPPPIDEEGRLQNPYGGNSSGLPERTNEFAGTYSNACIAVAKEQDILVVDFWSKMQETRGWQKALLRDGLHLTPAGNKILFEEVIEKLREGGLSLKNLPVDLPLFSEINVQDPSKSFSN